MPIFSFQRRKSSANLLQDFKSEPTSPAANVPSFRVLERPGSGLAATKSFQGGKALRDSLRASTREDKSTSSYLNAETAANARRSDAGVNRNSASTQKSASSSWVYDSYPPSARYSSSSTIPSYGSVDSLQEGNLPHSQNLRPTSYEAEHPPIPSRTISAEVLPNHPIPSLSTDDREADWREQNISLDFNQKVRHDLPVEQRGRAETRASQGSSATATPATFDRKKLDIEFLEDDGLAEMYRNFSASTPRSRSRSGSRLLETQQLEQPAQIVSRPAVQEPLLEKPEVTQQPSMDEEEDSLSNYAKYMRRLEKSSDPKPQGTLSRANNRPAIRSRATSAASQHLLKAQAPVPAPRQIAPQRNEQQLPRKGVTLSDGGDPTERLIHARHMSETSNTAEPVQTQKRPSYNEQPSSSEYFQAPRADVSPMRGLPINRGKVMTPAEFERYKTDTLNTKPSTSNTAIESDDSDASEDEGEDEDEKRRQMVRQRQKQDAKLAVYRQTMRKVTGEVSNPTGSRVGESATPPHMSPAGSPRGSVIQAKNDDEEDEDVPLGILAAHGFPTKERAPSHNTANPVQYASESYPSAAPSNSHMPAFARGLPTDPYVGASIVQPTSREMPSFRSMSSSENVRTTSPGALIDVIRDEENRRRIASPGRQQQQHSRASVVPPHQHPSNTTGQNMITMTPEQLQLQMMQYAQQMQQFAQMPQFQQAQPHMAMPGTRTSFAPPQPQLRPLSTTQLQQRPQSMVTPTLSPYQQASPQIPNVGLRGKAATPPVPAPRPMPLAQQQYLAKNGINAAEVQRQSLFLAEKPAYAASIAPSERSVSQTRYRTPPAIQTHSRSASISSFEIATGLPQPIRPFAGQGTRSSSFTLGSTGPQAPQLGALRSTSANATLSFGGARTMSFGIRGSTSQQDDDDDDDEQGWAGMLSKKKERKGLRNASGSTFKTKTARGDGSDKENDGVHVPGEFDVSVLGWTGED